MTTHDAEVLPAGHRARPAVALALWISVASAIAFTVFAYVTTQDRVVRAVSPWQDDPYDGVVSFTEFLVPALAVLTAVRASLCRRHEPQPIFRLVQLLRAAATSSLLVAATVLTDWLAVAARADHSHWNSGTPWLTAALVTLTAASAAAFVSQLRAFHRLPNRDHRRPEGDWLDDLTALVDTLAPRLPRQARRLANRLGDENATVFVRRHIVLFAATAALTAGLMITTSEAVSEGWSSPLLFLVATTVCFGAFFAFALICNVVLRIAVAREHEPAPATGRLRRAACAATIAGTLALPASVALRDDVWAALGHGQVDSPGGLAVVTFAGGLLVSVLAFGVSLILPAGRRPA